MSIDLIFLLIALGIGLVVMFFGFVNAVFGIVSLIGSFTIAMNYAARLGVKIHNSISNEILSNIIAFLLIFILSSLVFGILRNILSRIFSKGIMGSINRILGFILGFSEGLILIYFVVMMLVLQPFFDISELSKNSLFFELFAGSSSFLFDSKGAVA